MIEQTLRMISESRYRALIVTAGTFAVGLVLILPLVDLYSAERSAKTALLAELESAHQVANGLDQLKSRVALKVARLDALEAKTVDEQRLPALRTRIVELARDSGCSLRRLNVGTKLSRPWHANDDPTATGASAGGKPADSKTNFVLEWWPISVSVSGADANLRSLVERLEADDNLMHTKAFEMRPASVGRKTISLDMELWYFNLAREG